MAITSEARYAPTASAKSKEEKRAKREEEEKEKSGGGKEGEERVKVAEGEVDRGGQVFVAWHGMLCPWMSASGWGGGKR